MHRVTSATSREPLGERPCRAPDHRRTTRPSSSQGAAGLCRCNSFLLGSSQSLAGCSSPGAARVERSIALYRLIFLPSTVHLNMWVLGVKNNSRCSRLVIRQVASEYTAQVWRCTSVEGETCSLQIDRDHHLTHGPAIPVLEKAIDVQSRLRATSNRMQMVRLWAKKA